VIVLGDAPEPWEALGFAPDRDGLLALGDERIALTGRGGGILEVTAPDITTPEPDGLPLKPSARCQASQHSQLGELRVGAHPNGASVVDHLVVVTDSLARTVGALEAAGLDLRRSAGTMAFLRLGSYILEVVETGEGPARFWGLVVVVPDPGAMPGPVGPAKDAVQPGRRIATVSREAGLGVALAVMSPRLT
jgi:hypothetical protein